MDRQRILAVTGAIILFFGAFAPLLGFRILGSMNYVGTGQGDGTGIIVLAAISVALALRRRYAWLFTTGTCALAMLAFTFIRFQNLMSGGEAGAVQLEWGWAVLVVGAALLVAAALAAPDAAAQSLRACPLCAEMIQPAASICRYCQRAVPIVDRTGEAVASNHPRLPRRVLITTALLIAVLPPLPSWYLALLQSGFRYTVDSGGSPEPSSVAQLGTLTTPHNLAAMYEHQPDAAERMYTGNLLRFQGTIEELDNGPKGPESVRMPVMNSDWVIEAKLRAEGAAAAGLKTGKVIALQCIGDGSRQQTVRMKDCAVVSSQGMSGYR